MSPSQLMDLNKKDNRQELKQEKSLPCVESSDVILRPPTPPISKLSSPLSDTERHNKGNGNVQKEDSDAKLRPPQNILHVLKGHGNIGKVNEDSFLNKINLIKERKHQIKKDGISSSDSFKKIQLKKSQKVFEDMNCIELMRYIDEKRKRICTKEEKKHYNIPETYERIDLHNLNTFFIYLGLMKGARITTEEFKTIRSFVENLQTIYHDMEKHFFKLNKEEKKLTIKDILPNWMMSSDTISIEIQMGDLNKGIEIHKFMKLILQYEKFSKKVDTLVQNKRSQLKVLIEERKRERGILIENGTGISNNKIKEEEEEVEEADEEIDYEGTKTAPPLPFYFSCLIRRYQYDYLPLSLTINQDRKIRLDKKDRNRDDLQSANGNTTKTSVLTKVSEGIGIDSISQFSIFIAELILELRSGSKTSPAYSFYCLTDNEKTSINILIEASRSKLFSSVNNGSRNGNSKNTLHFSPKYTKKYWAYRIFHFLSSMRELKICPKNEKLLKKTFSR